MMASTGAEPLYLGLDLSTQQLKATIIDSSLRIVHESSVHFDNDLPHYCTKGGAIQNPDVTGEVITPTLVWVEALDVLFAQRIPRDLVARLLAISGDGQQHGSVFWAREPTDLDPAMSLVDQLSEGKYFSVLESPIWMDSSTRAECDVLEAHVGGAQALASITGSAGYERFTGNQIAKVFRTQREAYDKTIRISLVSSFVPSLLVGRFVDIDTSDGSGMNILNIRTKKWEASCLEGLVGGNKAEAKALEQRLGENVSEWDEVAGKVSTFWVQRFGLSPDCIVTTFTGDNPATLSSLITKAGDVVVSLGTSDTLFLTLDKCNPSPEGHVLCHPVIKNGFMAMLVYKNGSLTREYIRDRCAHSSWTVLGKLVASTPPLNNGNIGFYFHVPEITPRANGIFRFRNALDDTKEPELVDKFDDATEARALLESQVVSMWLHAKKIGLSPQRVLLTGGASANPDIQKMFANVFNVNVYRPIIGSNAGSLGGAYRAAFVQRQAANPSELTYEAMLESATEPAELLASPSSDRPDYEKFAQVYGKLEQKVVELGAF
ncbi:hypothetical protein BJ742DRAFT_756660 [Cladochytrium replicatum]|nr:hypothetical protein BJ742DRAFT_756660 [Cladochytrium replicatum]